MRSSAAILENDAGNIDSVEQKALELIRRFNDLDCEHALRGVFKNTDGLAEIRAKQRRAELEISRVLSELVVLRGAVGIVPISSALPPEADVAAVGRESPKLTHSGN